MFSRSPCCVSPYPPSGTNLPGNYGLAALTNMHVLHGNDLSPAGSNALQGKKA
jgi:hypothetical protein